MGESVLHLVAIRGQFGRFVRVAILLMTPTILMAVGSATAADPTGAVAATLHQAAESTIDELILQLGAPSFSQREEASRQLQRRGIETQPQLILALDHSDAEIRQRVRRVLRQIIEEDFRQRTAAFAAGHALDDQRQLPGWILFRGIAGDGADARSLYLSAIKSEPVLLESLNQDSVYAAFAVRSRADSLYTYLIRNPTMQGVVSNRQAANGNVAALLLAVANPSFDFDDQTGQKIFQLMQHSGYTQHLVPSSNQHAARRLAGQFIRRSADTSLAYQSLWLSMQCDLKEGLVPAETIIRRGERQPYVMQNAILAVGKLGGLEHLELLKPLLEDETPVDDRVRKGGFEPQVRDVALAVTMHLHGRNPKAYGFTKITSNLQTVFQPNTMGFDQQQQRDAAFKKWEAWVADQQAKGTESAGKG